MHRIRDEEREEEMRKGEDGFVLYAHCTLYAQPCMLPVAQSEE